MKQRRLLSPEKKGKDHEREKSTKSGSCAISVKLRWSESQHAETQQVKLRSTEHLSLHEFEPVHLSFDQPVAPRKGQRGSDGIIIPLNASCEGPQFSNRGVKRPLEPVVESCFLLLTQHRCKSLCFACHLSHIGMNGCNLLNLLALSVGQGFRRGKQQPGGASRGQLFRRIRCGRDRWQGHRRIYRWVTDIGEKGRHGCETPGEPLGLQIAPELTNRALSVETVLEQIPLIRSQRQGFSASATTGRGRGRMEVFANGFAVELEPMRNGSNG